ncbi:hypothetical protein BC1002_7050 (plasmid) [Paraburkholderia atlantica]|uniref:Uncharacterized protein n=1 Tax=Paraburkholderia atlantica TaxID=2654982 RepID=D5WND4_PARAM|nr:hypothetical protein BC1002_7050 [Paraburkholderia atlantica]
MPHPFNYPHPLAGRCHATSTYHGRVRPASTSSRSQQPSASVSSIRWLRRIAPHTHKDLARLPSPWRPHVAPKERWHLRAVTGQLERHLEEVDVERRDLLKGARISVALQTLPPSVADLAANDSAILLLDPRLVVLLVCTRPRKLDTRRFAEVAHRLVHEGAIVVAI